MKKRLISIILAVFIALSFTVSTSFAKSYNESSLKDLTKLIIEINSNDWDPLNG